MLSCSAENPTTYGKRTDALADSTWNISQWISAADAPVISGTVHDGTRSADGTNWFVSNVRNSRPCNTCFDI